MPVFKFLEMLKNLLDGFLENLSHLESYLH